MSPGAGRFAARYPTVWHVIEADGLEAARWFGLLPAVELRALAGVPACEDNRDDFVPLVLADGLMAVLRFQQMRDETLRHSLAGAYAGRPQLWRAMIDRRVFFWTEPDRRDKFLRATVRERERSRAAPDGADPIVLALATADLLRAHEGQATYSRINTGSTVLGGFRARRDEATFQRVTDFAKGKAAELAIEGRVNPALLPPA